MRASSNMVPGFSGAGLVAALVSACQIAGALVWINSPDFAPGGYANIALIASLCISVLVLSRLTLPTIVRFALIFGAIAVLLGVAVRGDVSGVKQVGDAVSAAIGSRQNGVVQPEEQVLDPRLHRAAGAARIDLRPGAGGDGGWASRLNQAARERVDQGAPAEIHGNVTLEGNSVERPRIGWAVTWAGVTLSCGRLTAMTRRPDELTNQVTDTFKRAVTRTAALKRPSCY